MSVFRVRASSGEERAFSFAGWREVPREERLSLAFRKSGKMALLALAFVFIPGLHFILVPGALLFAGRTFWKTLHDGRRAEESAGNCPKCGASILAGGASITYTCHCEKCGALLRVTFPG
ncbi:MAG: hypothetical protein HUU37_09460 [Bdellovibrionales bacterium]|nr:hypothetical protein [Bdellovibrionales bacterium]